MGLTVGADGCTIPIFDCMDGYVRESNGICELLSVQLWEWLWWTCRKNYYVK